MFEPRDLLNGRRARSISLLGTLRESSLQRAAATLLLFVVALSALAGGAVKVSHASLLTLGDLVVPICGERAANDPASPASGLPTKPDCCDGCVLGAPALLPIVQAFSRPAVVARASAPDLPPLWAPSLPRGWSPRQSRGPPAV